MMIIHMCIVCALIFWSKTKKCKKCFNVFFVQLVMHFYVIIFCTCDLHMLQIPSTMNTNNQPNGPKKELFKLQNFHMVYNLIKCVQ